MKPLALPPDFPNLDPNNWETIQPYFTELEARVLTPDNARQWLKDWSLLTEVVSEAITQIYIEKSLDTTDSAKEQAFLHMIEHIMPAYQVAEQALKERMLTLPLRPEDGADMAVVLRNIRNQAELFRAENVPLMTEVSKFANEYDNLTGGMEVMWQGEKMNLSQLTPYQRDPNREVREQTWHLTMDTWLKGREALNEQFRNMLVLRHQIALNAGLPDYRAYAFRDRSRFDYTPEDCLQFHKAIETAVVPAVQRILARKREKLGLTSLRPWDVLVDPNPVEPLRPYQGQAQLVQHTAAMMQKLDPELAGFVQTMADESLLDLDTRSGKAMGGYCSYLPLRKRPFIFVNGVGIHEDVITMLHEAGHAFHAFEASTLPLAWQMDVPAEFCEVASMSMELLSTPYWTKEQGGFYTTAEAARARLEHLEAIITFFPYMAVVDGFQHWVYTHPQEAQSAAACDACWGGLWQRFMVGQDWSGLEAERVTGWHRKLHIFQAPFYYVEYGMAQVGALQVWRNSLQDAPGAVQAYRRALALGGTCTLPELFAAAGAEFRFDSQMLGELVALMEETMADLERRL